ncbi:MAG: zinc dependent phospholipase C family protein [Ginsengibacter sp.]
MKKFLLVCSLAIISTPCFCWGFFAHKKINYYAVFLLPPQMLLFYKPHIDIITEHATDPDKRRYAVLPEGARHYIDIDHYGLYPYTALPHKWQEAIAKFGEDTLQTYGIVPWHIQTMLTRLTSSFKEKNFSSILKNSTELGHYIADAHVPLHATENHNGQLTGQKGIHAFWESRVPELLADKRFDFFLGQAQYIKDPATFIWDKVLESAKATDSVLRCERELSSHYPGDKKFAFEERNHNLIRQYSSAYTIAYDKVLNGMVERRMRQSIYAIASFWYTAWVNAGQPDLSTIANQSFSENDLKEFEKLNEEWKKGKEKKGREHE